MNTSFPTATRKKKIGVVSSNKAAKTIIVAIKRNFPHPMYGKIIRKISKIAVHDEQEIAQEGDLVSIQEMRPKSKTKRWRLLNVIEKNNINQYDSKRK